MSDRISALRKKARRLVEHRKHAKAVPIFEDLARLEATNPRWPHKLGECHQREGAADQAAAAFQRAAQLYAEQGFPIKAIALGRVVLGLQPANEGARALIATLTASQRGAAPPPRTPAQPFAAAPKPVPPRTIPLGKSLDAIDLRRVMPEARRQDAEPGQGAAYEIPLDEGPAAAVPQSAEQLVEHMRDTPLFSALDQEALRALVDRVVVRTFDAGDRIIIQGAPGDSLYVLADGEVAVYREAVKRVELGRLEEGAFFGEIAVLTSLDRSATVEAATDCTVLEVSRETIGELVAQHEVVLPVLLRFFRERMINTLVKTHRLFSPFSGAEQLELIKRFAFIEAEPDCALLRAGQPADGLYLLASGRATVAAHRAAALRTLGTGDLFGEVSLLSGQPSKVDVRTTTKCWLLKLDRTTFREVIMTHPYVLEVLSQTASSAIEESSIPLF